MSQKRIKKRDDNIDIVRTDVHDSDIIGRHHVDHKYSFFIFQKRLLVTKHVKKYASQAHSKL